MLWPAMDPEIERYQSQCLKQRAAGKPFPKSISYYHKSRSDAQLKEPDLVQQHWYRNLLSTVLWSGFVRRTGRFCPGVHGHQGRVSFEEIHSWTERKCWKWGRWDHHHCKRESYQNFNQSILAKVERPERDDWRPNRFRASGQPRRMENLRIWWVEWEEVVEAKAWRMVEKVEYGTSTKV